MSSGNLHTAAHTRLTSAAWQWDWDNPLKPVKNRNTSSASLSLSLPPLSITISSSSPHIRHAVAGPLHSGNLNTDLFTTRSHTGISRRQGHSESWKKSPLSLQLLTGKRRHVHGLFSRRRCSLTADDRRIYRSRGGRVYPGCRHVLRWLTDASTGCIPAWVFRSSPRKIRCFR